MIATLTGLGSGALHALSGPDHLVSLTPLSVGQARRGWAIGLLWGLGHGLGTLLLGALLLLAAARLPLATVATWGERLAGLALVGLGLQGLRATFELTLRAGLRARPQASPPNQAGPGALAWRPVALIGFVHGATGAAGLLLLLPAAASASPLHQALFLGGFALGSTLAMAGLTAAIASASRRPGAAALVRRAPPVASAASLLLGLSWLVAA